MNERILSIGLLLAALSALPGAAADERPTVSVSQLEEAPVIDGVIGEAEWEGVAVLDEYFTQIEPEFGEPSPFRTVIRIAQTGSALYVAVDAYDPEINRLSAAVTQRDGHLTHHDDSITVMLDSFRDQRTAYAFAANALATQWDASIANNGRTVDDLWDAAWSCAASRHDDRWTIEFEIPFEILRFRKGADQVWGFTVMRSVPRRLEKALWAGATESEWRVSSFGTLDGLNLTVRPQKSWMAIPYGLAVVDEDGEYDLELGGDFRWRPSSSLLSLIHI